jgi:hypothetical protein
MGDDTMNTDQSGIILSTTFCSSLLLILAIVVISLRSRSAEVKLLLMGIFTAIAAAANASVTGVSIQAGQVALATGIGSTILAKIAVILTLAGVGMMLLPRAVQAAPAQNIKEHPDAE